MTELTPVRHFGTPTQAPGLLADFPFSLSGNTRAVSIETIKRGEADQKSGKTIVLRTFEHLGGNADATLNM